MWVMTNKQIERLNMIYFTGDATINHQGGIAEQLGDRWLLQHQLIEFGGIGPSDTPGFMSRYVKVTALGEAHVQHYAKLFPALLIPQGKG